MKKILSILLAVALLLSWSSTAFASRIGEVLTVSSGIVDPHSHVTTSAAKIYSISFRANLARTWVAIVDSNTTGSYDNVGAYLAATVNAGNANVLIDLGEATAGDWVYKEFDPPLVCEKGILISYGTNLSATDDHVEHLGQDGSGTECATVNIRYGSK